MNWFKPTTTPIGLELGTHSLRAVQLRRQRGQWSAVDAIELSRLRPGQPFDEEEANRLAETLRRRAFVGQTLVVSLPDADLIRGLIDVDGKSDDGPMLEAALEIERNHRLEPGTYELAAWLPPASGQRRQTAVCVNGCRHADAETILNAFDRTGLAVAALESRACAVGRSLGHPNTKNELTAVLDIETGNTELILLHGDSVVYQRPLIDAGLEQAEKKLIDHGLETATARHALDHIGLVGHEHEHADPVRKALASYTQSLAQEADPALDYAARLYPDLPIRQLAVVGRGASIPALAYELQQQLRLGPATPPAIAETLPEPAAFAVALGLALHPEEASWAAA